MANQKHLDILKRGVEAWNQWRKEHPDTRPELSSANLNGLNLSKIDLSGANLKRADLDRTNLSGANLNMADLYKVDLKRAILIEADLSRAKLHRADFYRAKLDRANLSGAALIGADLSGASLRGTALNGAKLHRAILVRTNLMGANLTNCEIYGISAWDVQLEGTTQLDLVITLPHYPTITVDNVKVAQFIYLLLNNEEIRSVIDTITSKVVLILGSFTTERKAVLDALRDELRKQNYSPVIFDFEKPANRDMTETVSTLAHLARFIIVDLSDPSSAPHEVATIIPHCAVPVQPLLLQDDAKPRREYAMFHDLRTRYHWVLPTHQYQDTSSLLASLKECIINPAEQMAQELAKR